VLDVDATDDPVHGHQLGRFFHGYYRSYCHFPLYIFYGDHLLCARLRPSDIDGAAGALKQLGRIVAQIREAWPRVKVTVRADSGFCREPIMAWCERSGVDDILGLAQNTRLVAMIADESGQARRQFEATKQPARVFAEVRYQTLETWSRQRRVVAKAEHLAKGANPRFVVTSLPHDDRPARPLYEEDSCGRGEMENRIKEQQLHLFADRTSAATMRANQIRLFYSSIAYTLLNALRRLGLAGTELARAQCETIRRKLLKIGALVRVTVRKVWVHLSSGCPRAAVRTPRCSGGFTRACPGSDRSCCGADLTSGTPAGGRTSRPRCRSPVGVRLGDRRRVTCRGSELRADRRDVVQAPGIEGPDRRSDRTEVCRSPRAVERRLNTGW
jgi:hypothetical protein